MFYWWLDYEKKREFVEVPIGFKSDIGSIPRVFWIFFDKTKYISYIMHDYLYSKKWKIQRENKLSNINHTRKYTRKEADLIFLESLSVEWAWFIEKICLYLWVRIGGFLSFKKK